MTTRSWTSSAATTVSRYYGGGVLLPLLPPSYTPKVMFFGGGSPGRATTELIDLSATKNLKLRGSVDTDQSSRIGVYYEKDY